MNIFLDLFLTFFKIGAFTFGGGLAMLRMAQQEVLNHNWMDTLEVTNFVAISESTPGPFAVNMATYVGSQTGQQYGLWGSLFGAFCATMGVVLPSFIIILIVAKCYEAYKKSRIVRGCMTGLKPAVVSLIGGAIVTTMIKVFFADGFTKAVFTSAEFYVSLGIFALGCVLLFCKKIHPILLVGISAGLGIAWGYLSPLLGV